MRRKGQAALEFLTTYGWAFLVILVMIGALAYFGVLNPKNFLPSRCTFSPEIECIEAQILADGDLITSGNQPVVSFRFRNNAGASADFNISAVYLGSVNPSADCLNSTGQEISGVLAGRVMDATCPYATATPIIQGDKAKFEVTVLYKKTDGAYWTPLKGEIYGSIS